MSKVMREPKDVQVMGKDYVIHKFHVIEGREIVTQYPISGMPKLGEYKTNEALMLKVLAYVGVRNEAGGLLMLTTPALIENHVPDWETLVRLEWACMEYNCSFFSNGKASSFLDNLLQTLLTSATQMLTGSLEQLSQKGKPPSGS